MRAKFLASILTNMMSNLKVGRCRFMGLMWLGKMGFLAMTVCVARFDEDYVALPYDRAARTDPGHMKEWLNDPWGT